MSDLYLGVLLASALVLLLTVFSRVWKQRWFLTEPLTAFAGGVAVGPYGLDLLDAARWVTPELLLTASLFTLVIADMGVALRLPTGYVKQHARAVSVMLGPVMVLMWATSSILVWVFLDSGVWVALLAGAIVTSTDPVVSTSIVTGRLAERTVPARIRHLISAESGANDGMAYPLVMLPILMLELDTGPALGEWASHILLWGVGAAVVLGGVVGYLAGHLIRWALDHDILDAGTFLAYTVALSLLCLGAAELLGVGAVLAVFTAGIAYRTVQRGGPQDEEQQIQLALSQFLVLPMFALFGLSVPWTDWDDLGWTGTALAVSIVAARRLPAVLATHRAVTVFHHRRDWLFVGWFGPIGISTIFYAMVALDRDVAGADRIWALASQVVVFSLLAHGLTATPLALRYAKSVNRERP